MLATDGLVKFIGEQVRVTEAGRSFVRSLAAIFDFHMECDQGYYLRDV